MGPVETTYRLSDLFAVNFRSWRAYLRALAFIEFFFVAVILVFPLFDGWTIEEALRFGDWWLPIGIGVILLTLWFGFCPFLSYWRTKRLGALGPNKLWFDEKGIKVDSPRAESLVYWSALKRVTSSKKRLYLFITNASALIIPRRELSSDQEFEAWAERAKTSWAAANESPQRD